MSQSNSWNGDTRNRTNDGDGDGGGCCGSLLDKGKPLAQSAAKGLVLQAVGPELTEDGRLILVMDEKTIVSSLLVAVAALVTFVAVCFYAAQNSTTIETGERNSNLSCIGRVGRGGSGLSTPCWPIQAYPNYESTTWASASSGNQSLWDWFLSSDPPLVTMILQKDHPSGMRRGSRVSGRLAFVPPGLGFHGDILGDRGTGLEAITGGDIKKIGPGHILTAGLGYDSVVFTVFDRLEAFNIQKAYSKKRDDVKPPGRFNAMGATTVGLEGVSIIWQVVTDFNTFGVQGYPEWQADDVLTFEDGRMMNMSDVLCLARGPEVETQFLGRDDFICFGSNPTIVSVLAQGFAWVPAVIGILSCVANSLLKRRTSA